MHFNCFIVTRKICTNDSSVFVFVFYAHLLDVLAFDRRHSLCFVAGKKKKTNKKITNKEKKENYEKS